MLDAFEKAIDGDGYVVEKRDTNQRVLTTRGDEIKRNQFAGVLQGSTIFLKSDIDCLIDAADRIR